MKWALCLLDFGWHAIDESNPDGAMEALCGHPLPSVTLHDEPCGRPCEACAALQVLQLEDPQPEIGGVSMT